MLQLTSAELKELTMENLIEIHQDVLLNRPSRLKTPAAIKARAVEEESQATMKKNGMIADIPFEIPQLDEPQGSRFVETEDFPVHTPSRFVGEADDIVDHPDDRFVDDGSGFEVENG